MKIQRRLSPSKMALGAALALTAAGCGNSDVLGVYVMVSGQWQFW